MTDDEPVRIVPYDACWPALFDAEAQLLAEAMGEFVVGGIHHVGSTSVPGLAAKPIIDIAVGVADLQSSRPCIELVAPLGYLYWPYLAAEMHWFCKPDPSRRTHHLHLLPVTSARFADELAFRDFLRSHPETARDYEALKLRLAAEYRDDRDGYTAAKGEFVARILSLAGAS